MVLRSVLLLTVLVFLFSCGGEEPVTESTEEKEQGPMMIEEARTIYLVNCASCHGPEGNLKASNSADLTISKKDDAAIKSTIQNGNDKGMMPYKEMLSEREIDGLVEFVKSLRK